MTSELNDSIASHEVNDGADEVLAQLKQISAKHGWTAATKHAQSAGDEEHNVMEVILESKTSLCGTPHDANLSSPQSRSSTRSKLDFESLISQHEQRESAWNRERQRYIAEIEKYKRQMAVHNNKSESGALGVFGCF